MSFRHALATVAAVAALAPASAFAQGAGDDQYSDPFGDESEQATPTATPQRPAATATPAPAQPAQTATPAPSQPSKKDPDPGPASLPDTGVDPWPMALGGVLLLGTGLALRLRVERAD
jgi:LPXTG-motif cell wall-anchored protein